MNRSKWLTLGVILITGTLTQICTDMYIPSMGAISLSLHTSIGQVQWTMSALIFGVAFSGLLYGAISEIAGRRNTLLLGILISLIGGSICLFADSISQLQLGRFIQGCGLGACSTLWRTIFRDNYAGDEMARVGSYLANFILISVILAPFIGGYIEQYASWRVTFIVLTVWTIAVMIFVSRYYHDSPKSKSEETLSLKFFGKTYLTLLGNPQFMGYTMCSFLSYGGLFAWLTAGPVLLIKGANISPVLFGWLSIITGGAMALGGTVNGKYVEYAGSQVMIQIGWLIMVIAGLILITGYQWLGINVWTILIPGVIFIFGSTLTFANAFANAFSDIGHIAGFGGGLYSGIQLMGGAFFSAILSHLNTTSPIPMALLFISSGICSWLVFKLLATRHTTAPNAS